MDMLYDCEVYIRPRKDILDPQGDAVNKALVSLGFQGVDDVRIGRFIQLSVDASDEITAKERVSEMCSKLLANPITEDFEIKVITR